MLCTMDVTSLYTNIPHSAGLAAVEYYLQINQVPHTEFLLTLTRNVLVKNYFMFQYCLQTQGTAMGSPVASNYTNLFMGKFEHDFIYSNNPFKQHIKVWYRYMDNVLFIWLGSNTEKGRMPKCICVNKKKRLMHSVASFRSSELIISLASTLRTVKRQKLSEGCSYSHIHDLQTFKFCLSGS